MTHTDPETTVVTWCKFVWAHAESTDCRMVVLVTKEPRLMSPHILSKPPTAHEAAWAADIHLLVHAPVKVWPLVQSSTVMQQ
jgi:hypothetical protein